MLTDLFCRFNNNTREFLAAKIGATTVPDARRKRRKACQEWFEPTTEPGRQRLIWGGRGLVALSHLFFSAALMWFLTFLKDLSGAAVRQRGRKTDTRVVSGRVRRKEKQKRQMEVKIKQRPVEASDLAAFAPPPYGRCPSVQPGACAPLHNLWLVWSADSSLAV